MKNSLIVFTIGLVLTGCANTNITSSNEQNVDTKVPVEEKLIKSETVEIQKETVVESIETTIPQKPDSVETTEAKIIVVGNPEDLLVLVNKHNTLPSNYVPDDLVVPNIPFSFDEDVPKRYLRKEAAEALEQLFREAKAENMELFGASGYRSFSRQETIYSYNVNEKGEEAANQVSAIPGQSEHQTGLAMDVTSQKVGFDLIEEFGETIEGIWLQENAHQFGFIIRYPKGKEAITEYSYEPWHLRFVGKEAAAVIFANEMTLEEYSPNYHVNKKETAISGAENTLN